MRQNVHFFKEWAHESYRDGLRQLGIGVERIPRIEEMDTLLKPFGWGAVPIDGLIPGVAFFDFQAHGLLPIAIDIRTREQIGYTPAPDIIHEAAGHAPILCHEEYSFYVKHFGRMGRLALSNREEQEVFLATRRLSQIMEDPRSTPEIIQAAQHQWEEIQARVTTLSEATLVSRLYWWTVEYGLIGDLRNPKIYGAGLLSSVTEGQHCLSDEVKKFPFDLDHCLETDYDVTRPQPQLFVCRDFRELMDAVDRLAERLAHRTGGTDGLLKAARSAEVATAVLSSGIQITGTFSTPVLNDEGEAIYLQTTGATALSCANQEIPGHGKQAHPDGFGTPIGGVYGLPKRLEHCTMDDFKKQGWDFGKRVELAFESGVHVSGIWVNAVFHQGKCLLLTFEACEVRYRGEWLFRPEWGRFDMAVGQRIASVFAVAADPEAYFDPPEEDPETPEPIPSVSTLDHLYQAVRAIREGLENPDRLPNLIQALDGIAPDDWLLRLEIMEILEERPLPEKSTLLPSLKTEMERFAEENEALKPLILNGLKLIQE